MNPFFFIPASKLHKLPDILDLGIQELIIDFEDSITTEQQAELQLVFTKLDNFTKYWYRIPLRSNFDEAINTIKSKS